MKDLPPEVAQSFAKDMRLYFEAKGNKRDEIAARQITALNNIRGPRDKKVRLADVKAMFVELRNFLDGEDGG